jgi:hypothetical protein
MQHSYSVKKSSLVAVAIAIGCGCGWKMIRAPLQTMLAQNGTALEVRRSAKKVPAMLGQVFASIVPASLTIPPLTPAEGEAEGLGEGCWVVANQGDLPAVAVFSTCGEGYSPPNSGGGGCRLLWGGKVTPLN